MTSATTDCGAPLPAFGTSWVSARWTAPDGRQRAGSIPVSTSLAAARTVQLWVDTAGSPSGPPPRDGVPDAGEVLVVVLAAAALGAVLWWLAGPGWWMLDRRRLADWEAAWAAVGP